MLQHVSGTYIGIEGVDFAGALELKVKNVGQYSNGSSSSVTSIACELLRPQKILPYNRSSILQAHAWQVTQRHNIKPLSVQNIIVQCILNRPAFAPNQIFMNKAQCHTLKSVMTRL